MSGLQQPTIDAQKKFWEWHWQHWDARKTVNEWKNKRHERVVQYVNSLELTTQARILDVGCGPGWYTNKLSKFGSVMGIDLSEEAIDMAKAAFPHITFAAGNLYDYPLSRHFDLVVAQEVIDHVEDSPRFVDRVAHVLKPGGYLVLSCTNKFVIDRLDERECPPNPPDHIGRYLNRRMLKRLLSPRFEFLRSETILPLGHRGILRFTNSQKLNDVLGSIISKEHIERMKEQAGLGYQIIALAQKL